MYVCVSWVLVVACFLACLLFKNKKLVIELDARRIGEDQGGEKYD